jgi:hypothetical protein
LLAPPAPLLGDAGVHVAQGVDELNVESGLSPSHSFAGQGQVPENLFYFIFLLIYFLKVGNDPLGGRRRLDHARRQGGSGQSFFSSGIMARAFDLLQPKLLIIILLL